MYYNRAIMTSNFPVSNNRRSESLELDSVSSSYYKSLYKMLLASASSKVSSNMSITFSY